MNIEPPARGVRLVVYRAVDGSAPLLEWLAAQDPRARAKCFVRLERLETHGRNLRRAEALYLRNDVYELRARHAGRIYHMTYFFHGLGTVVVAHGFATKSRPDDRRATREAVVLALDGKKTFESDPARHTWVPDEVIR
ncbi:MAG: hypothetical protein GY711_07455 [bacterium]|nr:hypothetical protein [bacterium]